MDNSGNNRYEILFMDGEDDGGIVPAQPVATAPVLKKTQAPALSATVKKAGPVANKQSQNAKKENKSGTLNRNDAPVKRADGPRGGGGGGKVDQSGSKKDREGHDNGLNRKVAFTSQVGEDGDQRNNRRNFHAVSQNGDISNERHEQRQNRDRDNRGSQYRNRVGKREFDRQSGSDKTGVKAVDKRDGAGAHNWGSVKQEIEDINKSTTDDPALAEKEESSGEQVAVPDENEAKEMTLDEWKAMRGERSKPQYNLRQPNEGEDTTQWKKMVALNKKKSGESSEEELEYDPSLYPQRVGRLQRIVDIQFNFKDGRRGGGGFGRGRGRGRGFGPGGDNRGNRQEPASATSHSFGDRQQKRSPPSALNVDEENQFPTLC